MRTAGGRDPSWQGIVISVQPRIRLIRSYDIREHEYLGYALGIRGDVAGEQPEFWVGIGKRAQARHQFRVGDAVAGMAHSVIDPRRETVDLYKASRLRIVQRAAAPPSPPPWHGVPPELEVYRGRGHRRLDARTYEVRCKSCLWGCRMPVEMIIDHWKPDVRRYRAETFCYGPKSCALYKAGPTRKVPGRRGLVYEEEDWVDAEATAHRDPDD